MKPSVYLSQPTVLNALGHDTESVAHALFSGQTAGMVAEAHLLPFDPQRLVRVGRVNCELPAMPTEMVRHESRNNQLLMVAAEPLRVRVEAAKRQFGATRIGVVLGTSTSGIGEAQVALQQRSLAGTVPTNYRYSQQELGSPALFLAEWLDLQGPAYTVSTACTSSAKAFASARRLMRLNLCDAVLVGGADALCPLTVNGFTALESTTANLMNPMSKNRQGINLGEGAALFLMSHEPDTFELLGIGESSDAHHISAPHPEGVGAEMAMRAALLDAGLTETDVSYINLHATATPKNDAMESMAVARVFPQGIAASGTKPMTGHLLGAAGATELALCALALTHGRLPPHVWDGFQDPELPSLDLVSGRQEFTPHKQRICMSNSFAFGGSNASLLIGLSR